MNLDPLVVVILAAVFLAGAIINGLIGMGLALIAVNAVGTALDPKAGVVVLSLIAPFLSSYQLRHNWSFMAGWRRLRSLVASAVLGSIVGAQLLVLLPSWAIGLALGIFTVQFVVDRMRRERPALAHGAARRLAPVAGFIGGVTNSSLGASGPVIGSYLLAIGMRGREFAFGISVVFFIQALVRVGSLAALGQYTPPLMLLAFVLLWPSLLGQHIGQRYQGRANPVIFQRVLLVVLLVSSLNLLVQGGRGLLAWLGIA
jgi:uncharacterized membrane protein YfcA